MRNIYLFLIIFFVWTRCYSANYRWSLFDEGNDRSLSSLSWKSTMCTVKGLTVGYYETEEMSLTNYMRGFDPIIKVSWNTRFIWGCERNNITTLKPRDVKYVGTTAVLAEYKTFKADLDTNNICSGDFGRHKFPECGENTRTILALCASAVLSPANPVGHTLLKCLPVPMSPPPYPYGDGSNFAVNISPKILYVSYDKWENLFKPKVKIVVGSSIRSCKDTSGRVYLEGYTNKCPNSHPTELAFSKPVEKEVELDLINPADKEFSISYRGKEFKSKIKVKQGEVCLYNDNVFSGCIPMPNPGNPEIKLNQNNDGLSVYFEENPSYKVELEVAKKDRIPIIKNFYNNSIYAFKTQSALFTNSQLDEGEKEYVCRKDKDGKVAYEKCNQDSNGSLEFYKNHDDGDMICISGWTNSSRLIYKKNGNRTPIYRKEPALHQVNNFGDGYDDSLSKNIFTLSQNVLDTMTKNNEFITLVENGKNVNYVFESAKRKTLYPPRSTQLFYENGDPAFLSQAEVETLENASPYDLNLCVSTDPIIKEIQEVKKTLLKITNEDKALKSSLVELKRRKEELAAKFPGGVIDISKGTPELVSEAVKNYDEIQVAEYIIEMQGKIKEKLEVKKGVLEDKIGRPEWFLVSVISKLESEIADLEKDLSYVKEYVRKQILSQRKRSGVID